MIIPPRAWQAGQVRSFVESCVYGVAECGAAQRVHPAFRKALPEYFFRCGNNKSCR